MNSISSRIIKIIIYIAFALLLLQIFNIQFLRKDLKLSSENISVRRITDYPQRGIILDRNGNVLVYNRPVYQLTYTPILCEPFDTLLLSKSLGLSKEELVQRLKNAEKTSLYRESVILQNINIDTFIYFMESAHKFKGFSYNVKYERTYNYESAAHVLGYIAEVTPEEIKKDNYYKQGDFIGKSGLEAYYENYLRGKKGVRRFFVDARGRIIKSFNNGLNDTLSVSGKNIKISLDINLQMFAESLLVGKRGAIVAIEPKTGQILVMASSPTYNPSLLKLSSLKKNYEELRKNRYLPLFNRAIASNHNPPGSTFKILTALLALKEKVISYNTVIACNYGYRQGSHIVKCHHGGAVDFRYSIVGSCNTYYCTVMERMINRKNKEIAYREWVESVKRYGIATKLGVDLVGEGIGYLPTVNRFALEFGPRWTGQSIAPLGMGQGLIGVTPLQLANLITIFANRGYYYPPHFIVEIEDDTIPSIYKKKIVVDEDTSYYKEIIDAMELVVRQGTAAGIFTPDFVQCGKTGTAQVPPFKDNSIFIGFAPKYEPKIAIAVYIERVGWGGTVAAPIASLIMEKYLTGTVKRKNLLYNIFNIKTSDEIIKK